MSSLSQQGVWTFFFNKPFTQDETQQLIEGIELDKVQMRDFNNTDESWHSVYLKDYAEVNKLRAVLMLEEYEAKIIRTESGRYYFDVKRG